MTCVSVPKPGGPRRLLAARSQDEGAAPKRKRGEIAPLLVRAFVLLCPFLQSLAQCLSLNDQLIKTRE